MSHAWCLGYLPSKFKVSLCMTVYVSHILISSQAWTMEPHQGCLLSFYKKIWFSFSILVLNNIPLAIEIEGSDWLVMLPRNQAPTVQEQPFWHRDQVSLKIVLLLWSGPLCVICFIVSFRGSVWDLIWWACCILLMNLMEYIFIPIFLYFCSR